MKKDDYVWGLFPTMNMSPQGWLKEQLIIQAKGLSGHLHEFWPSIKESQWVGGKNEGWERVPYWLDGLIPLAWLIDDKDLKAVCKKYIDAIIDRQKADGWICPTEDRASYDLWALFLVLKTLTVWSDATGDDRVQGVIEKALKNCDMHIDRNTLFGWGQTRWFEALISISWLHARTGEKWLMDLAVKLRAQGFDWPALFEDWPYEKAQEHGRWSQMNHVVNQAMMLKGQSMYEACMGREVIDHVPLSMLGQLDKYHGVVTGMFNGDECLSGKSPIQGHELCAVVEFMYSLEWLTAITHDAYWGDRLESVTYNALPATFLPDMTAHQYDQQVNQVECSHQEDPLFLTNGPEANLFGVEPDFGCCTANMHQGWPKFASSIFMSAEDGIAITAYAPMKLKTTIEDADIMVSLETDYPFKNSIKVKVNASKSSLFSIYLRIPAWAKDASIKMGGKAEKVEAGKYHEIHRKWDGDTEIELILPMEATLIGRDNDLYSIKRGPLVYSLPIEERRVKQEKSEGKEKPWLNNIEIFPVSPWNYALCIDEGNLKELEFIEKKVLPGVFDHNTAPVEVWVDAKTVPWSMSHGAAAAYPEGKAVGEKVKIRLVPYGCTTLRMTEMPLAE